MNKKVLITINPYKYLYYLKKTINNHIYNTCNLLKIFYSQSIFVIIFTVQNHNSSKVSESFISLKTKYHYSKVKGRIQAFIPKLPTISSPCIHNAAEQPWLRPETLFNEACKSSFEMISLVDHPLVGL